MTRNEEIVRDNANGMSITQLAMKYSLSRSRVWQIISNKKTAKVRKESNAIPYVFGRYYPELSPSFRTNTVNSVMRKHGYCGKIGIAEFVQILDKYEPLTADTFLNVGEKGVIFLNRIKEDYVSGRFDDLAS